MVPRQMTTVDIHAADQYTAITQAKKAAAEQARYSLADLIRPDEVQDGAERWEDVDEDVLHDEVGEAIGVMVSEGQIPAITDLAIVLWRESLPRVPMDHMAFESKEEAVRHGYWPHTMNRTDVTQLLWEYQDEAEFFHEYQDDAESRLFEVLRDAVHPLNQPDV